METPARLLLCLAAFIVALVLVSLPILPSIGAVAGKQENLGVLLERWLEQRQIAEDLDEDLVEVMHSMDRKRELTQALLNGRLTLAEAAAQFRDLGEVGTWARPKGSILPGRTELE